jgi:hypothetical protein
LTFFALTAASIGASASVRIVATMPRVPKPTRDLIAAKVAQAGDGSGCWLWTGATTPGGTPIPVKKGGPAAHRWLWEDQNGPIPERHAIRATCGRTNCVALAHLELVSIADLRAETGRRRALPTAERFARKVQFDEATGCHLWTGRRTANGYGIFDDKPRVWLAHRWAWADANGAIPEGLVLDHLCRTRRCVNVNHLEPVTLQENIARGDAGKWRRAITHCKRGHRFTVENTIAYSSGVRRCRRCRNELRRASTKLPANTIPR